MTPRGLWRAVWWPPSNTFVVASREWGLGGSAHRAYESLGGVDAWCEWLDMAAHGEHTTGMYR